MTPAIEIEELTKDYAVGFWRPRPYRALDRLSLTIEPGEVFGFLGPNGAGKTTTLKLLMQLIFPTVGPRRDPRPAGRRRRDAAPHRLPAGESLLLRLPHRRRAARRTSRSCSAYRAADRARARRRDCSTASASARERRFQLRKFSKGMIQRVGIAQALLNDPEVVFLDEPMSGLDPLGRRDVRALILELRDQGRTVFFSSHILSDAEALCSRVAIVAGGRLAAPGRLAEHRRVRGPRLGARRRRTSRRRALERARARRARASPRSAAAATRSSCRSTQPPEQIAARARRRRRVDRVAQSAARDARGLLRAAGRGSRRRARAPRRRGAACAPLGTSPSTSSASRCATACPTTWCCSRCC